MTTSKDAIVKPFLKWAGGKRWFAANHRGLLPSNFRRYFEPFLGSGAVFFDLLPKHAYLSDTNAELIECYAAIRDDWRSVWDRLRWHSRRHSKEHYYKTRESKPRSRSNCAARLIYLNRTCFNGMYRVNLAGKFNVPIGTKSTVVFPDDDFAALAGALKTAKLCCCDFEKALSSVREGDFVYLDPPYTVKHNKNNFVKYNEQIFRWQDQERLGRVIALAADRGALILVSNADSQFVRKLYQGEWHFHRLVRYSVLASSSSKRRKTTELAILNYESNSRDLNSC